MSNPTGAIFVLILVVMIFAIIAAVSLSSYIRIRDRYNNVVQRIVLNEDLINSSIHTLSTAYGISEEDLKDYINERGLR